MSVKISCNILPLLIHLSVLDSEDEALFYQEDQNDNISDTLSDDEDSNGRLYDD